MAKFKLGLIILAFQGVQGENYLRGQEDNRELRGISRRRDWNEQMGQCTGAICGVWGDPHIISCDGRGYDCQGKGIFQLHKSSIFDIQGHFVDIGEVEKGLVAGWGLRQGATLTNDIAIRYLGPEKEDYETVQFGFGNLTMHNETEGFWAETGCTIGKRYHPLNGVGVGVKNTESFEECRAYCEEHKDKGCNKFTWFAQGNCHITNEGATLIDTPKKWARSTAGSLDSDCGNPPDPDPQEAEVGWIWRKCPLMVFVDGKMIDTSHLDEKYIWKKRNNDFTEGEKEPIYGDEETSNVYIERIDSHVVRVVHKLPSGAVAENYGIANGQGPGRLWSCHWDIYTCLPGEEQDEFKETSIGLYGSPNGNPHDDIMNNKGEPIRLVNNGDWHKTMIDWCYEQWCVSQDDSIFTYPGKTTYENWKCEHMDYEPFVISNEKCVISVEDIQTACTTDADGEKIPPLLKRACEIDCCEGGCDHIMETLKEIKDIKPLGDDDDDEEIFYDIIVEETACDDSHIKDTSDEVCPNKDIVKLVSSVGAADLPDADIFYGIKLDTGDDIKERTIKFKVTNPFEGLANVFVKYDQKKIGSFLDPTCLNLPDTTKDCDNDAPEIEIGCHEYNGNPIAFVEVFFAAESIPFDVESSVHKCCKPPAFPESTGVVGYAFQIQCSCPDGTATE